MNIHISWWVLPLALFITPFMVRGGAYGARQAIAVLVCWTAAIAVCIGRLFS